MPARRNPRGPRPALLFDAWGRAQAPDGGAAAFEPRLDDLTLKGVMEAIPPERLAGYVRELEAQARAAAAAATAGEAGEASFEEAVPDIELLRSRLDGGSAPEP